MDHESKDPSRSLFQMIEYTEVPNKVNIEVQLAFSPFSLV